MPRAHIDKTTGMTEKQERFCVLYVTGGEDNEPELIGNGSACYRIAFSPRTATAKSINERASRLLANRKIQARIKLLRDTIAERAGMTRTEIMKIAAHMARATLADFYDESGALKLPSEWTDEMRHAAAGLKTHDLFEGHGDERVKVGEVKELRLCDKNAAVDRWFKHFGLYEKDNKQKSDPITQLLEAINGKTAKLTVNKKPIG